MKNILRIGAFTVLMAVATGFASAGRSGVSEPEQEVKTINRFGQVGLWNTHSAQTLGKRHMAFGLYGDLTGHEDYIVRAWSAQTNKSATIGGKDIERGDLDYSMFTFRPYMSYGISNFFDVSLMIPVYVDHISTGFDYALIDGSLRKSSTDSRYGHGDLEIGMKFLYPLDSREDFFTMAYYGGLTLPIGQSSHGRFPRKHHYINKQSVETGYFTAGDENIEVDMKMLWTWDFNRISTALPLLFHFNYGLRWVTNSDMNHVFLLNTGLEFRPQPWVSAFLEFSAEPSFATVEKQEVPSMKPGANAGETVNLDPRHSPMRVSPGLFFLLPNGFTLSAGAEFNVARTTGSFHQIKHDDHGDYAILETAVEPKAKFVFALGWNGPVFRNRVALDSDGDGIPDSEDLCPFTPGRAQFFGCPNPDRSGDGVCDPWVAEKGLSEEFSHICTGTDLCPDVKGLAEFNGCPNPDKDGDGLCDPWVAELGLSAHFAHICTGTDRCPDVAGPRENDGCPINDRDGDGIPDSEDLCPDTPGLAAFQGCPNPDKDGDGVCDPWVHEMGLSSHFAHICTGIDRCPDEPGPIDNDGCPVIVVQQEIPRAQEIARGAIILDGVNFETGSARLTRGSYRILDDVIESLRDWPEVTLRVEGHTDSSGSYELNQRLSYERAQSVVDYFVAEGISASRLQAVGKGPSEPIADNQTATGRAANRRVELHRTDN